MKSLNEPRSVSHQMSNLKSSLNTWDELINKSSKLFTSASVTIQCMSGLLEAFQKISDIAETSNAGLRPFGIAIRRFCLRQFSIESKIRNLNSQLNDCLVTPLSDRLDEWRRTANQIDRDCGKEIRKARSELHRATIEANKCQKRHHRKERGGFNKSDVKHVQMNFLQNDLENKQRTLDVLEQRCLEAISIEERRRFSELHTCLRPILDTHLKVLGELVTMEEAVRGLQAVHPAVIGAPSQSLDGLISAHSFPTSVSSQGSDVAFNSPGICVALDSTHGAFTGPPHLPSWSGFEGSGDGSILSGETGSDGISLFNRTGPVVGSVRATSSNGDADSLSSAHSRTHVHVDDCDDGSGRNSSSDCQRRVGARGDEGQFRLSGTSSASSFHCADQINGADGVVDGSLTDEEEEADNNDKTLDAGHQSFLSTGLITTEHSTLYPNQVLPPPVYKNLDRLKAAVAASFRGASRVNENSAEHYSSRPISSCSALVSSDDRVYSQSTATISRSCVSALHNLSINRRSAMMQSSDPVAGEFPADAGVALPPRPTSIASSLAEPGDGFRRPQTAATAGVSNAPVFAVAEDDDFTSTFRRVGQSAPSRPSTASFRVYHTVAQRHHLFAEASTPPPIQQRQHLEQYQPLAPPRLNGDLPAVPPPPRRSSSVCQGLPTLSRGPHDFCPSGSHFTAPRGMQQHPRCIYAEPQSLQQHQQHRHSQDVLPASTTIRRSPDSYHLYDQHHLHRYQEHHLLDPSCMDHPPAPPPSQ